jgi:hypothetical protein
MYKEDTNGPTDNCGTAGVRSDGRVLAYAAGQELSVDHFRHADRAAWLNACGSEGLEHLDEYSHFVMLSEAKNL